MARPASRLSSENFSGRTTKSVEALGGISGYKDRYLADVRIGTNNMLKKYLHRKNLFSIDSRPDDGGILFKEYDEGLNWIMTIEMVGSFEDISRFCEIGIKQGWIIEGTVRYAMATYVGGRAVGSGPEKPRRKSDVVKEVEKRLDKEADIIATQNVALWRGYRPAVTTEEKFELREKARAKLARQ